MLIAARPVGYNRHLAAQPGNTIPHAGTSDSGLSRAKEKTPSQGNPARGSCHMLGLFSLPVSSWTKPAA